MLRCATGLLHLMAPKMTTLGLSIRVLDQKTSGYQPGSSATARHGMAQLYSIELGGSRSRAPELLALRRQRVPHERSKTRLPVGASSETTIQDFMWRADATPGREAGALVRL